MKKVILLFISSWLCFSLKANNEVLIKSQGQLPKQEIALGFYSMFLWSDFNPDRIEHVKSQDNLWAYKYSNSATNPILYFYSPNSTQMVYTTPGDSVYIGIQQIEGNEIYHFTGRNSAHYNFFALLNLRFKMKDTPHYSNGSNLNEYKEKVLLWRDKKLSFLETFIHKNSVSHDFYQWAKAEIRNEAIAFLYQPFLEKHIDYTLKPLNYFSDIFLIKNNYSRYYYIALAYKNINFYTNNTEDIEAIYKHIITDFEGDEKEYLLASLIGTYAMQNNIDIKDKIKLVVDESYKQIKNPDYLYYFEHAKDYCFILNKEFPDKVLSNTFLKSYATNDTLSLKDYLLLHGKKALYIDFWASWCSPCREDIKNSAEAKKFIYDSNVTYLYLSRDEKEDAWRKEAKKLNITCDQYLILNIKESPILKYLDINYIPRYIIVNKNHEIVNNNAPKPVPETLNLLKQSIDKLKMKTITF